MKTSGKTSDDQKKIDAILAAAEEECKASNIRMTAIRREVLRLILSHDRPVGAYDILEELRLTRRNAAPLNVYRTLDFLLSRGLIHRLERLAAFVACSHTRALHGLDAPRHKVQFLICLQCHDVREICGGDIEEAIAETAAASGFTRHHSTVEIEGICDRCTHHNLHNASTINLTKRAAQQVDLTY